MKTRQYALSLACVLVSLLGLPDRAMGASYVVQSCQEDVRELLPSTDWTHEPGEGQFDLLTDCSAGAVIVKPAYESTIPPGGGGGVTFTAPAPLSIKGFGHRAVWDIPASTDATRPWKWDFINTAGQLDGNVVRVSSCAPPCKFYISTPNASFRPPIRSLTWYLLCEYETRTSCPGGAEIRLFDVNFEIDDPTPPKLVHPPSGAMFSGSVDLTGTQTVGYEAMDAGSGVYRAEVEVDGVILGRRTSTSDQYPRCTTPFRVVQPCPASVVNGMTVDTRTLADGVHSATLRVFDATDRNVVTYGPVSFSTANRRLRNFCDSSLLRARTNVPKRAIQYGKRWTYRAVARGTAGHEVVLLEGRDRISVVGSGVVGSDEGVVFPLPAAANRILRLAVRPAGSTTAYVCSRAAKLRVGAKVTLSATPEEVSNGRVVRLRGRLLGSASAKRAVVVQARAVGSRRWSTVKVVRTRRNGKFNMRYRFLSTFSTVTYVFRAQVRSAKGYPYATGTSGQRRVRVFGSGV